MKRSLDRLRSTARDFDAPDVDELRERVYSAVEDALARAGNLIDDAPDRDDIVRGVRQRSRSAELAASAALAAAPHALRMARSRVLRGRRSRAAKLVAVVPVAVTRRSVFATGGVGVALVGGFFVARWAWRRRQAAMDASRGAGVIDGTDLELQVERMEDEGGEPAGSAVAASNGSGSYARR